MQIDADFDAGNIIVEEVDSNQDIRLRIRKDVGDEHSQWFHFRVRNAAGRPCTYRITDAHKTSYPSGWENYRAVASEDGQDWFRVPTTYENGELLISHTPRTDEVRYAYFAPYDFDRHRELLDRSSRKSGVRKLHLGETLDGRPLDGLLIEPIEGAEAPLVGWIIARQHPGETMAEWWVEGFLDRLLESGDPVASEIRRRFRLYVVPNMNPDGSVRGHLRCNAVGANLNREWIEPSAERSPEVLAVRDKMDDTGVDFFLDVHGDEALPYNFISAAEGIPGWTPRLHSLTETFKRAYENANPDFQRVFGYPLDKPGEGNLSMASNQVSERFDCLGLTLEMPFKDNANAPDEIHGWSPARSRRLGASVLEVMAEMASILR